MTQIVPSVKRFNQKFPNEEACRAHLREQRWGKDAFECPRCGEAEHWGEISTRNLFECYACNYQCSVTAGTVMQDTKLDLWDWFLAAYLILTWKKGISSEELARRLEVTQTTAYFLQQKLACVVKRRYGRTLFGLVEADETYVGHPGSTRGRGTEKDQLLILVEDKDDTAGNAHIEHVPNAQRETLSPLIRGHVQPGSTVKTDGLPTYLNLEQMAFEHERLVSNPANEEDGHEADQGDEEENSAVENLPWMHVIAANLQRVMEGVHTTYASGLLERYIALFEHRLQFRGNLWNGFLVGLDGLAGQEPMTWEELKMGEKAGVREHTEIAA